MNIRPTKNVENVAENDCENNKARTSATGADYEWSELSGKRSPSIGIVDTDASLRENRQREN